MTYDVGRIRHDSVLMHYSRMSNGSAAPSNWALRATGDTGMAFAPDSGGGSVSYGSNSNQVSYVNAPGASSLVSRADHVHLGVTNLSHTSNTFAGPIILTASGSLGITVPTPGTFNLSSVASSGSGGGGTGLTTVAQDISADFTSANDSAWHDITGLTGISLAAGTWVVIVELEIGSAATFGPVFRLTDGTTTYAQSGYLSGASISTANYHHSFSSKPFTLGSTTSVKVQVFTDTVLTVLKFPGRGSDTGAVATHVTALKVA